jgi:hypothetical protein
LTTRLGTTSISPYLRSSGDKMGDKGPGSKGAGKKPKGGGKKVGGK